MSEYDRPPVDNVRAARYFVARADGRCRRCGRRTPVLAVALPQGHETLEEEAPAGAEDDDEAAEWQIAEGSAFLFHIQRISVAVSSRLLEVSPGFRLARSLATLSSYWANHCDHCGQLFEDHDLHCEPGGAFVATSEFAAALIELEEIDEPLSAAAGGYEFEPEFFEFMQRR